MARLLATAVSSSAAIAETMLEPRSWRMNCAAERRIDGADRRREHDEADDLAVGEAERLAGLDLPRGHRFDAGADDLGDIGAEMDRQRDDGRDVARQPQADEGQGEIDEEELDEERRVADELDIDARERRDRARAEHLGDCSDDADQEAEDHRDDRQLQRPHQPPEQQRPAVEDRPEVKDVVHDPLSR